jgi:hypothetical protein
MIADSVAYLKSHGREVIVDAEHFFDGHRANREYALRVLEAAARADFGRKDGVVLIGHLDEPLVRASYPRHLPMSTSILAFHKLEYDDEGRPALVLERHGSLLADDVRRVAAAHGFGVVLADGARERLPMRGDVALA